MIKKIKVLATVSISLLTASGLAQAADPILPQQPSDNHRVVVAIEELGNKIEALTKAA